MTVVIDTSLDEEEKRVRHETIARRQRLLRRGRGCALWVLPIAVLLGVGTWFLITTLAWADRRAGEQALAEARAAGVPLTLPDLVALQPTSPEIAEATRLWRRAIEKLDVEPFQDPAFAKLPVIGERRADDGLDPPDRDAQGHLQGKDLADAKAFVSQFDETFDLARSARDAGGVANFEAPIDGKAVGAPANVVQLVYLATALRLRVETRLADDDLDGALDDLSTLMAVSDALLYEPYYWHQHSRHRMLEWSVELLERMFAVEELDDFRLRLLADAFRERDEATSSRLALGGLRYQFVSLVEQADEGFTQNLNIDHASWARGADLAKGLDLFAQMDEASEQGLLAAKARWQSVDAELQALGAESSAKSRYPATLMLVPQTGLQIDSHRKAEASLALARTAIACERYRLKDDKLPGSLDDLVPDFLSKPSIDPCDGKPLRYVSDAGGVQLYSVGSDGVDDGGGAAASSGAAMFTPSDIVFRLKKTKSNVKAKESP